MDVRHILFAILVVLFPGGKVSRLRAELLFFDRNRGSLISCFARAQSMGLLLPFRFLSGAFGSVGATLVAGTISDLWSTRERGFKMGLFALCAVLGTCESLKASRVQGTLVADDSPSYRASSHGLGRDESAPRVALGAVDPGDSCRCIPTIGLVHDARDSINDPSATQGQRVEETTHINEARSLYCAERDRQAATSSNDEGQLDKAVA